MKNNQLFFYILLFFSINNTFAQSKLDELEFIYNFRRNNYESKTSLRFDKNYQIWEEISDLMPRSGADVNFERFGKYERSKIYKSVSDSLILTKYFVMKKIYNIKDPLIDFQWEMIDTTATVLGKKCKAAKTKFRGRSYLAFYTEEIPTTSGPWKFHGLPGLILKVTSNDYNEIYNIECIEIKKNEKKEKLNTLFNRYLNKKRVNFVSWEEFNNNIDIYIEKIIKYHQANTEEEEDDRGNSGFKLINYLEIFHKAQKETIWY